MYNVKAGLHVSTLLGHLQALVVGNPTMHRAFFVWIYTTRA